MRRITGKTVVKFMIVLMLGYAVNIWAPTVFSEEVDEILGIEGGYFTCATPEGWGRTDNDPYYGDEETFLMSFDGPSVEGLPVLIYISFYGAGNEDFEGQEDFLARNTTDIFGETIALPEPAEVNGRNALTFGYERKQYLDLVSKDETRVTVKKKFYVLTGKDGEGFYVLEYFSPSSAYDEFLPVFQKVVDSFQIV